MDTVEAPALLRLPPNLEAQIARLVLAIPRPRYSTTISQMLIKHGLVTEVEVAELRGVDIATMQIQRSRGQMPPHFKWGELVAYDADDIAAMIRAERIENAAYKRRHATKTDILGAA